MESLNRTIETYFILIVFSDRPQVKILLFIQFLAIYLVTLLGNVLLITVRILDHRLHTPMYFFLSHLSFIDICFTSAIAPKMLNNFLTGNATISFLGCAAQMFFALSLGSTECLLLAIMAYDRHAAICKPLHYHVIMSRRICHLLTASCWGSGIVNSLLHTIFTFQYPFCKSRETRHYFCEIQPMLRLACADTHKHELSLFATSVAVVICSFMLTIFSYIHIIATILKIQSSKGKSKVFSTCSSHLLVVIIFYGTLTSVYMRPISTYTPKRDRIIAVLYTLVIPMCNPLIYSLRNKEVKNAVRKVLQKIC